MISSIRSSLPLVRTIHRGSGATHRGCVPAPIVRSNATYFSARARSRRLRFWRCRFPASESEDRRSFTLCPTEQAHPLMQDRPASTSARNFSASMAAMQPVPAAVIAQAIDMVLAIAARKHALNIRVHARICHDIALLIEFKPVPRTSSYSAHGRWQEIRHLPAAPLLPRF